MDNMEAIGKDLLNKSAEETKTEKEPFEDLSVSEKTDNAKPIDEKSNDMETKEDSFSLRKFQRENYNKKVDFINLEGFEEMRALEKDKEFVLKKEGLDEKRFIKYTSDVNKLIIKNVLLQKFELTYKKFELKGGNEEHNKLLESCKTNGLNYLNEVLESSNIDNKKLRKCAKIARGETFLFKSSENNDKCIWLELKKVGDRKDGDVLEGQEYFLQRHIDEGADISNMSDVLLQGKKLFDFYLSEKKIRYVISSSWLFDDEFNKFWMEKRRERGIDGVPNRIKIREESLNYGGISPAGEAEEDVERFFIGEKNSMTRAREEYEKGGKKIKEGKGYIDLEKLEKWKSNLKQ